ncbi:hypothetical protein LINPERPRIM_LOCUS35122 [Linum perenne]
MKGLDVEVNPHYTV